MRFFRLTGILAVALSLGAQDQSAPPTHAGEKRGVPPRAAPTDYEAHGTAGDVTIAAEFLGHSIPRDQGEPLISEDHVVIEMALYGPPNAHTKISLDSFSLRINEKKKLPLAAQPFGMLFHGLKEPEWQAQADLEVKKNKDDRAGVNKNPGEPLPPPKMPLELQRVIQEHVQKVALPEGDRPLPAAGLIFFKYYGKVESIHTMELTYTGPTGTVTLPLQ